MEKNKINEFIIYLKEYYDFEEVQNILSCLIENKKIIFDSSDELTEMGININNNHMKDQIMFSIDLSDISDLIENSTDNIVDYIPIKDLNLSPRSYHCLSKSNINTVGELCKLTTEELREIPGLGAKSFEEIINTLKINGYMINEDLKVHENNIEEAESNINGLTLIKNLGLSIRSTKWLMKAGIDNVEQLCELTEYELFKIKNIGSGSVREIKQKLFNLGLSLREGFYDYDDYYDQEQSQDEIRYFEEPNASTCDEIETDENNENTEIDFLTFYNSLKK